MRSELRWSLNIALLRSLWFSGALAVSAGPAMAQDTPSFTDRQTYFGSAGFFIDQARNEFGPSVRGGGITIGDVEKAYNPFHRELAGLGIVDLSLTPAQGDGKAGIAMCRRDEKSGCLPSPCESFDAQHGSAVLGMLLARDKASGIRGIVPDAKAVFSSVNLWNADSVHGSEAIKRTIAKLGAGDVMLLEMQGPLAANPGQGGPADVDAKIDALIRSATAKGIITVMGAGNSGLNLDLLDELKDYRARPDNGAIIVGAARSDGSGQRTPESNYGSSVDVYAWGDGITTSGYSYDLAGGTYRRLWPAPATNDFKPELGCVGPTGQAQSDILAAIGNRPRNYYTSQFGGTSGASAMVAGLAAAISGFAKDRLGRTLTSTEVRTLLIQSGKKPIAGLGVQPNLQRALANLMPSATISADSPFFMTQHQRIAAEGWIDLNDGPVNANAPLLLAADAMTPKSTATLYVGLSAPAPKEKTRKLFLSTMTRSRYHDGISVSADGNTWIPLANPIEFYAEFRKVDLREVRCFSNYDLTEPVNTILLNTFGAGDFSSNPLAHIRFRFENAVKSGRPAYDHIYDEIIIRWHDVPPAGPPCPDMG